MVPRTLLRTARSAWANFSRGRPRANWPTCQGSKDGSDMDGKNSEFQGWTYMNYIGELRVVVHLIRFLSISGCRMRMTWMDSWWDCWIFIFDRHVPIENWCHQLGILKPPGLEDPELRFWGAHSDQGGHRGHLCHPDRVHFGGGHTELHLGRINEDQWEWLGILTWRYLRPCKNVRPYFVGRFDIPLHIGLTYRPYMVSNSNESVPVTALMAGAAGAEWNPWKKQRLKGMRMCRMSI